MNNARRKQIDALIARLENELTPSIREIEESIDEIRDDEQEYYDNMPESFQNGEKGETAQAAVDSLENAISELDGCDFEAVVASLNEAQE